MEFVPVDQVVGFFGWDEAERPVGKDGYIGTRDLFFRKIGNRWSDCFCFRAMIEKIQPRGHRDSGGLTVASSLDCLHRIWTRERQARMTCHRHLHDFSDRPIIFEHNQIRLYHTFSDTTSSITTTFYLFLHDSTHLNPSVEYHVDDECHESSRRMSYFCVFKKKVREQETCGIDLGRRLRRLSNMYF